MEHDSMRATALMLSCLLSYPISLISNFVCAGMRA